MNLPNALRTEIIDFLTSLPNVHDNTSQQAFIASVGLDFQLQRQIQYPGSPVQFFNLLVSQLIQYGQLEDGRNALKAVLETAKEYVGKDQRKQCDTLIQQLQEVPPLKPSLLPQKLLKHKRPQNSAT